MTSGQPGGQQKPGLFWQREKHQLYLESALIADLCLVLPFNDQTEWSLKWLVEFPSHHIRNAVSFKVEKKHQPGTSRISLCTQTLCVTFCGVHQNIAHSTLPRARAVPGA